MTKFQIPFVHGGRCWPSFKLLSLISKMTKSQIPFVHGGCWPSFQLFFPDFKNDKIPNFLCAWGCWPSFQLLSLSSKMIKFQIPFIHGVDVDLLSNFLFLISKMTKSQIPFVQIPFVIHVVLRSQCLQRPLSSPTYSWRCHGQLQYIGRFYQVRT